MSKDLRTAIVSQWQNSLFTATLAHRHFHTDTGTVHIFSHFNYSAQGTNIFTYLTIQVNTNKSPASVCNQYYWS